MSSPTNFRRGRSYQKKLQITIEDMCQDLDEDLIEFIRTTLCDFNRVSYDTTLEKNIRLLPSLYALEKLNYEVEKFHPLSEGSENLTKLDFHFTFMDV